MPMLKAVKSKLDESIAIINDVLEDKSVPRNIRDALAEAKNTLLKEKLVVENISSAMYLIDDISNDLNMPIHTRTDIWNILSILEEIKEQIKKK